MAICAFGLLGSTVESGAIDVEVEDVASGIAADTSEAPTRGVNETDDDVEHSKSLVSMILTTCHILTAITHS